MTEHWLVLGASSSIARAFIRIVAARGAAVTVAGRDLEDLAAIAADAKLRGAAAARTLECDATDPDSRAACVAQALLPDTELNVLVAIGSMPDQEAMQAQPALLASMIESTYLGPVALLEGLAPAFIQQRKGRIVVIGSVAGDRGRLKNHLYGSAKAGLATYTEGLRARMFRAGPTVTLVKPGFVDTSMTWGLPGLFLVASPEAVARDMLAAADKGKAVVYLPRFWRLIMLIIQHIPTAIMKRLAF
jgi:short-subunit dehydrogenase